MTHRDPSGRRNQLDGLTVFFLGVGIMMVACLLAGALWVLERIFNFVH